MGPGFGFPGGPSGLATRGRYLFYALSGGRIDVIDLCRLYSDAEWETVGVGSLDLLGQVTGVAVGRRAGRPTFRP